ncbi:hypothetical protein AQ14_1313 [Francisella tularensis subsp. novicida D9876]|uniref:hypothetical protein n=1 Tax=Francisella tularensis TaxID=263 RepID=UPI00051579E3|nr:hypothetical protein [Francisella tularensis]AJI73377.1 hypothetical protein AQ14_1313 [Francisella tularensis subsp. novicida D9876]
MINSSLNNSQVTGDTPLIGGNTTGETSFNTVEESKDDKFIYSTQKSAWDVVMYLSTKRPKRSLMYLVIMLPVVAIFVFFYYFNDVNGAPLLAYYIFTTTFIIYPIYILLVYFLIYRASN